MVNIDAILDSDRSGGVSLRPMMEKKIWGILREGKVPPDRRVAFTPDQCVQLKHDFDIELIIQPSVKRCFADADYLEAGVAVQEDLSSCDIILGIKEVPIPDLIPSKTYLFFSHTGKKQTYNRKLLQAILAKNIRLVDYEYLTDDRGDRVTAFGYHAGVVGAHNTLYAYGQRSGDFVLPRMRDLLDYEAAKAIYKSTVFPPLKVIVTGTGRVGRGAVDVLKDMGFKEVTPDQFLTIDGFDTPVYTVLSPHHYARRKDGGAFIKSEFYADPRPYESDLLPYLAQGDILINAILWKAGAPIFFTKEDMAQPTFKTLVIGDISCDIAPDGSIPSTLKASTIEEPVFGFSPETGMEIAPYQVEGVDMMTIDNLPSELPRDASRAFGDQLIQQVVSHLISGNDPMITRATIAENGQLTTKFSYLQDYVDGN